MKKQNLDKESGEKKVISATIILEIIGKPQEHLLKTLEGIIEKINNEKGVKIISKKINEPVLMKDNKEFFTTFAEIDLEVEDILYLTVIMFKYMPAHVEIISPDLIALTNNGWTDILSELSRRLHGYEEIARILQLQNAQMQKKIKELTEKDSPNTVASSKELTEKDTKEEKK